MRKSIFTLTLIMIGTVCSIAQVSLSSRTLYYNAANSSDEITLKTVVTNNATDPSDDTLTWTIIEQTLLSNWGISYCDPVDCKTALTLGDFSSFKLNPGSFAEMKMGLFFNNISGNGKLTATIKSKKNPQFIDTIFFIANSWTTNVKDIEKNQSFSFYPNPVKDQISIKYPSKDNVKIEIFNVLGMKVKTINQEGNITSLQVSDLKKGIYFIRITDGTTILSKQFSKAD